MFSKKLLIDDLINITKVDDINQQPAITDYCEKFIELFFNFQSAITLDGWPSKLLLYFPQIDKVCKIESIQKLKLIPTLDNDGEINGLIFYPHNRPLADFTSHIAIDTQFINPTNDPELYDSDNLILCLELHNFETKEKAEQMFRYYERAFEWCMRKLTT